MCRLISRSYLGRKYHVWIRCTGTRTHLDHRPCHLWPGKLPDVGKALGKSIREFKSASNDEDGKKDDKMINVTAETKETPVKKDEQK